MSRKLISILIVIIIYTACKDYSDLTIVVKNNSLDVLNPELEIALVGSEQIKGIINVKIGEETIGQGEIESHFDSEFSMITIDLTNLESLTKTISSSNHLKNEIKLNLVFVNEKEKVKVEKPISTKIILPPISKVENIEGDNFEKVNISNVSLISSIIKNKSRVIEPKNSLNDFKILKGSDKINIKVIVDTIYNKTLIGRYPVKESEIYKNASIEDALKNSINNELDEIKSDFKETLANGKYLVQDEIDANYSGFVGLYLINIDDLGNFFVQQIGIFCVDEISPNFNNSTNCSFSGNPKIEGQVCLDSKHFFGYNPYNVPFVGKAYGDVSKIIVDNMNVKFTIGEEIYFKKRIYLDGGYNRVPVKIVDKKGNVTET